LAVVATAGILALAGCGQATDSPDTNAPATSAPADPAARLTAATAKFGSLSYVFTVEYDGGTGEVTYHAPSKSARLTMKTVEEGQEATLEVIRIGEDAWMRIDLGVLPDDPAEKAIAEEFAKWRHLSAEDQKDKDLSSTLSIASGALGSTALASTTGLTETAPGAFAGVIDMTKAKDLGLFDDADLAKLGDKARTVPITMTIDGEDRLTSFTIDVPETESTNAGKFVVKFADFDAVTAPTAPPASS